MSAGNIYSVWVCRVISKSNKVDQIDKRFAKWSRQVVKVDQVDVLHETTRWWWTATNKVAGTTLPVSWPLRSRGHSFYLPAYNTALLN